MPKHMTPAERDRCIELWRAGATLDHLAGVFDRDRTTIDRLVARRKAQRKRRVDPLTIAPTVVC